VWVAVTDTQAGNRDSGPCPQRACIAHCYYWQNTALLLATSQNAHLQIFQPEPLCAWHKSSFGLGPESSSAKQNLQFLPYLKNHIAIDPFLHIPWFPAASEQPPMPSHHDNCLSASCQHYTHHHPASSRYLELFSFPPMSALLSLCMEKPSLSFVCLVCFYPAFKTLYSITSFMKYFLTSPLITLVALAFKPPWHLLHNVLMHLILMGLHALLFHLDRGSHKRLYSQCLAQCLAHSKYSPLQ
jgi:hypothetical protein